MKSHSCAPLFLRPGRIDSANSLFYYAPWESYATFARAGFKPLFIEDVLRNMTAEKKTKAKETCGDNKECLFDFAITGTLLLLFTLFWKLFTLLVHLKIIS